MCPGRERITSIVLQAAAARLSAQLAASGPFACHLGALHSGCIPKIRMEHTSMVMSVDLDARDAGDVQGIRKHH